MELIQFFFPNELFLVRKHQFIETKTLQCF